MCEHVFKSKGKAKECRAFHRAELEKEEEGPIVIVTTNPTQGPTPDAPIQNPRYEVSPCDTPNMEDSNEEQTCAQNSEAEWD